MGSRPVRRHGGSLRVFVLAFVVFAYFMPQWADWNIDSRLDLVHALVDDHTVRIDRYHFNTWDKAVYRGHYYSDKAPGTAVLGVVVYGGFVVARGAPILGGGITALEKNSAWNTAISLGRTDTQAKPAAKGRVLGGCQRAGTGNVQVIPWGNRLYPPFRDWALSKYLVTVFTVALISAAFAAFFFWFLGCFSLPPVVRWGATLLYAFATVALAYSANFYSHQLAAGFLFTAFALLYLRSRDDVRFWAVPAAGFLLGFSLFTEYTVGLVVVLVGLYGLWALRRSPRSIATLVGAGAVPVLGLLAYNAACFGSPFDTGYSHDFCWSAAQAGGVAGFTYPRPGALWDLTFGSFRGLFYMSPWLLLALPGCYILARSDELRIEAALCLVVSVGFILAISSYWGWNGGKVDGPRYLVPIVPFLAFGAAFGMEIAWHRWWSRVLRALLVAPSVFITWALFLGGPTFPTSWLRNPLTEYSLPALQHGTITSNAGLFFGLTGWATLAPLVVLALLVAAWRRPEEWRSLLAS